MPAATLGAPQTICRVSPLADIDLAELELVGVGMLVDRQHMGHDDAGNSGATGSFSSTSRPAMVSRWHSSDSRAPD
jgi:hypothetical protein